MLFQEEEDSSQFTILKVLEHQGIHRLPDFLPIVTTPGQLASTVWFYLTLLALMHLKIKILLNLLNLPGSAGI